MKDYEVLVHRFPNGVELVLDTRSEEEQEQERIMKMNGKFLAAQQRLLDVLNSIEPPKSWFNK